MGGSSMSFAQRSTILAGMFAALSVCLQLAAEDARPKDISFKKSWITFVSPAQDKPVKAGEEFKVTIKYFLDASENWGEGTKLVLVPLGPWVDCPDGKYTKGRHHEMYPGLFTQEVK